MDSPKIEPEIEVCTPQGKLQMLAKCRCRSFNQGHNFAGIGFHFSFFYDVTEEGDCRYIKFVLLCSHK